MRISSSIVVFALGCGGSNLKTVEPAPRPQPAQGGFQAQRPPVDTWRNLGIPQETAPMQRTLHLAGQGGQIATLMIKGVSGEPEVLQVQVEYMDKSVKQIDVDRRFVPGDGQVIELRNDRPIDKIIVFIDPDSQGVIEIFGS